MQYPSQSISDREKLLHKKYTYIKHTMGIIIVDIKIDADRVIEHPSHIKTYVC